MGDIEHCRLCHRPLLELEGQFERLQPYYAEPGDPAMTIVGSIHTPCLVESPYGERWAKWRVAHFTTVRGYEISEQADGWTVLRHRRLRELIAFHDSGASVGAQREQGGLKAFAEGSGVLFESDSHLSINDREFIALVQAELATSKRVPLSRIVDKLEIRDRLQWPGVLDAGQYLLSRPLRRDWTPTSFSARESYYALLPSCALETWNSL